MGTQTEPMDAAIAAQLRGAAAARNVTRVEIAKHAGIPDRTLARYMKGERSITISQLRDICRAIGVDMGDLIDAAEDSLGE